MINPVRSRSSGWLEGEGLVYGLGEEWYLRMYKCRSTPQDLWRKQHGKLGVDSTAGPNVAKE
jgi:hypothetical protein